jgi:hypothetical protein
MRKTSNDVQPQAGRIATPTDRYAAHSQQEYVHETNISILPGAIAGAAVTGCVGDKSLISISREEKSAQQFWLVREG